jgi:hypothetical protein
LVTMAVETIDKDRAMIQAMIDSNRSDSDSSESDNEQSTATFFLWNQTKITINLKFVIKMFLYNYSFYYL